MKMQNALYIEISFIGICLLLTILINQRQDIGSSTLQRQFNIFIYSLITMLVVDAVCWLLDGATFPHARIYILLGQTVYFFLNIMIPFLWVVYVEFTQKDKQKTIFRRLRLLSIPLVALTVLLLVNLHTSIVFIIDENNIYHRNTGYLAYAILAYAYLAYATVRAVIAAHHASWVEEKRKYYPMTLFVVLPAVGGIIQMFLYGVTLIWISVAISTLLLYLDSLNRQISADPLTGLNNRRELSKYLFRETRDTMCESVLSLIMMDVDDFKQVNDTLGHFYGDNVLVAVSEILKQACKNTEAFLARYGGDEFCIVYRAKDTDAVESMISSIQANVARWNKKSNEIVSIGLSIGYAIWQPEIDENIEALYKQADQKMYQAKNAKKAIRSVA